MKDHKPAFPKAPVSDHINKQGMYTNFIRNGSSEQAKRTFLRPPFYMTEAKPKGEEKEVVNDE